MYGIFTHICLIFTISSGEYTDAMGFSGLCPTFIQVNDTFEFCPGENGISTHSMVSPGERYQRRSFEQWRKNPGCLGFIGDYTTYTTQLYGEYKDVFWGLRLNTQYNGKYPSFFMRGSFRYITMISHWRKPSFSVNSLSKLSSRKGYHTLESLRKSGPMVWTTGVFHRHGKCDSSSEWSDHQPNPE